MAKKKEIEAATNFLTHCFTGDIPAITTIVCAHADWLSGEKEGKDTILTALKDVRKFCDELITVIEKEDD